MRKEPHLHARTRSPCAARLPQVKALRKHTDAFLDCHLCVVHPEAYVADMAAAGASQFTFHIEVRARRGGGGQAALRAPRL